jgi:hypothetical protein
MARAPGSGRPRRPKSETAAPRRQRTTAAAIPPATEESRAIETALQAPEARAVVAAASGSGESALRQESIVAEPPDSAKPPAGPIASRFQIFIIDTGWHSPARKVLHENFAMLRALQQADPIYVLSAEKSLAFILGHPSLMGKGPIVSVHDLRALREGGTNGFHGFRLHLGLMHSEAQALLALQSFARFLATHRQSVDLEADIRRDLRREGIIGAIEIIMHHEPRDIGG